MATADDDYKEVRFDKYCSKCKYKDVDDTKGQPPCHECLSDPVNYGTEVPVKFKAKEK